jgi:hypothetical protein
MTCRALHIGGCGGLEMISQTTLDALEARFGPTSAGNASTEKHHPNPMMDFISAANCGRVRAMLPKLESMPLLLLESRNGLTRVDMAWKPSDHEYSILEHLRHLRDTETQRHGVQICRMLAADQPWLMAVYRDALAEPDQYHKQHALAVINDFFKARLANVQRINALLSKHPAREHTATHLDTARVVDAVRAMAAHDHKHLETVRSIRKMLLTL